MHSHPDFIATHRFDAPRERVWRAWTERDALLRWFGPRGLRMTHAELDLRPGGAFHYALATPDGDTLWGLWLIREVVANERLVMEIRFSDPQRGVTRHPGNAGWPLRTLATTIFEDAGDGTLVTVHWNALDATPAEQAVFDGAHADMERGWSGTFEQLEDYLRASLL
jgi:uncharacterized protein YndB with AHSA1/START domain